MPATTREAECGDAAGTPNGVSKTHRASAQAATMASPSPAQRRDERRAPKYSAGHDPEDLAARGAEGAEQGALAHALVAAGRDRAREHDAPVTRLKSAMNRMASVTWPTSFSTAACTVEMSTAVRLLKRSTRRRWMRAARGRVLDAREQQRALRRLLQDPGLEHDEEVGLEAGPVHLPHARDVGDDRQSLHVPGDRVAQRHAEFRGEAHLDRDRVRCAARRRRAATTCPATSFSDDTSVSR